MTRLRASATLGLAVLALLVSAGPAAADPPGPTNFRAEVVGIEPTVDGLEVEVLGGDAFLQLRNDGHEVIVPGYRGDEQYLWFEPDGTVHVNLRSTAYWLNRSRYLLDQEQAPADVGPNQPPRWEQVATDGSWAWHDHRIHWMNPGSLPPDVDPDLDEPQLAYEWPEPLVLDVDGAPVEVAGSLTWYPDASPWLALLGLVVGAGLVELLRRRGTRLALVVGAVVGVAATGVVGLAGAVGLPAGVEAEPLPLVLTGIAGVVAVAGLAVQRRTVAGAAVAGAAGIPLVLWAMANLGAVTAPVVPPDGVPAEVVRLVVGLAAGVGVAMVAAGVRDLFDQPLAPPGDTVREATSRPASEAAADPA